ncbi:MAG: hypothetical protein JHD16_11690, partial [Solirubrobacteraceae bacterium]|nr:hypothetical protein [Solirubrobacteraceae bacterium]
MSSTDRPNPIDTLLRAGRLFGAQLPVLLPVLLLLQAVKAGLLLGAIAAVGEDIGSLIGGLTAAMLLATVVGISALVAIDDHDGHRATSPGELVRAALPFALAFALGAVVAGLLLAPALLFGLGVAFLTPWMQSARRGESPGLSVRESAKRAAALGRTAVIPTVLLLASYKFAVHLIPALADSLV